MWCNSFPEGCSETSARARWCAWFSAMIAGGDALGFSFGFTIFGERRFQSAAWPPFETADRDLIEINVSGPNRRFDRRLCTRRMKAPIEIQVLGFQFGSFVLRPRPQNETADRAFSGAKMYFHMPCFWSL